MHGERERVEALLGIELVALDARLLGHELHMRGKAQIDEVAPVGYRLLDEGGGDEREQVEGLEPPDDVVA